MRRQLYTAVDRGERYKMKCNMSLKYFPKQSVNKVEWLGKNPRPRSSPLNLAAEAASWAIRVRGWSCATLRGDCRAKKHISWHRRMTFNLNYAPNLSEAHVSSTPYVAQNETVSGSENYDLVLSIDFALPPSLRAKIKSCCDFFKCRPLLRLSRRHCVLINLNHCWARSATR